MEVCANCHRTIGDLETPRIFHEHIVCAECDARLQSAPTAAAARAVHSSTASELGAVGARGTSTQSPPPIPTAGEPRGTQDVLRGVGGWLTFFCVGLTILSPLLSLGHMSNSWDKAKPAFARFPSLRTAIIVENTGFAAIVIYGFISGVRIWGGSPAGKRLAQRYLLIRLFGSIDIELLALGLMSELPSAAVTAVAGGIFGALIGEVIYFLIWWFYFMKSKRVKNTYAADAV